MTSGKRTQLPQDDLGGVSTRPRGLRRDGRAIKGGLKASSSGVKLANRHSAEVAAGPRGSSLGDLIKKANKSRDQYNPLRGLTIRKARSMVETYHRGDFADLMWAYHWIEQQDETLFAVVTRREAALRKLDWDIKVTPDDELPPGSTPKQAKAQAVTLRTAYDRISNLRDAIAHLALATFRGFAHLEKQDTDGDGEIDRLEPIPQWNVVRDGLEGDWWYNETGRRISARGLPADMRLDPENFIIRTLRRHVDWPALFCFIRKSLSQKDWDAFCEGFGLNPVIIINPPGVPKEREPEYASAAQNVSDHGGGSLPYGSDVKYANKEKGQTPFKEHIDEQKANIVLVATGGKLTMLNDANLGSFPGIIASTTYVDVRAPTIAVNLAQLKGAVVGPWYRAGLVLYDTLGDGSSGDWFYDPYSTAADSPVVVRPDGWGVFTPGRWFKR